jgi:hypothetical protein
VYALVLASDAFRTSPNPFIALMVIGFGVGVLGYLAGSRVLVGVGVALVFFATLLLPLALNVYR